MTPLTVDQVVGVAILLAIIAFGIWHIGTWVRAYRRCQVIRRDVWAYQDHQRDTAIQQLEADQRRRFEAAINLTEYRSRR